MPVIADAYSKGIRDFDAEALYEAMKASSDRDTFGYFLKAFRGARHYNRYGYVPCDLEITSVSKTLEYCYDDWCIAQMARMLGREEDYERYIERAGRYRNLFDSSLRFMRGRLSEEAGARRSTRFCRIITARGTTSARGPRGSGRFSCRTMERD